VTNLMDVSGCIVDAGEPRYTCEKLYPGSLNVTLPWNPKVVELPVGRHR
jgi:hypothetical protein